MLRVGTAKINLCLEHSTTPHDAAPCAANLLAWIRAHGTLPVRGKGQALPFVDTERQALPRLLLRTTGRQPARAGEEVAMPTRPLPNDPSLEHLRKEAKRLAKRVRAGDAAAIAQALEFHPRAAEAITRVSLTDAQ